MATWNPFLACTFVDNPDTDTSFGEQVISSKLLAYAYMLTAEGYPFIYGKDYFSGDVWPGAYGLKPWIDNLIWIHETLASRPDRKPLGRRRGDRAEPHRLASDC